MSQEQADRAKQQLYEDTSARDELTDDEANVLLKWSESQIDSLAAQNLDDAAFDEAYTHLRRVVMNINRFTGKRTYAPPDELSATLSQLATEAGALGADVSAEQLAIPQAQASDDNIALINALTSMVTVDKAALLNKIGQQAAAPAAPESGEKLSPDLIDKVQRAAQPSLLEQADKAALLDKIGQAAEPTAPESADNPPPDRPQTDQGQDDRPGDSDGGLLGKLKDLL